MRMSVSIFGPKAFSMRKAMSPDRLALPFNRLESAGRETRRTFAAAVTVRPSGAMISVRMKSPGCGGFMIDTGSLSFDARRSVIVFKIQIADFAFGLVDPESHPPIPRYV